MPRQPRYSIPGLPQHDAYLLGCYCYIELNPVRAGMVRLPGDYPYPSYPDKALGKPDNLITEHAVYRSGDDSATPIGGLPKSVF